MEHVAIAATQQARKRTNGVERVRWALFVTTKLHSAIAGKIRVDDGDRSKVDWKYDQVAIGEHRYNVKVQIEYSELNKNNPLTK